MNECKAIGQQINNELGILARIEKFPEDTPAVAACVKHFGTEYTVAMNLSRRIFASGRASASQHQQMKASENNLRQLRSQLSRSGLTMNECKAIGQQINNELGILARIEKFREDTPAVAACVKHHNKEHDAAMKTLRAIRHTGRATSQQLQQLAAIELNLGQLRMKLHYVTLTMNECQAIGQQIASEHNTLARMPLSGPPPSVQPRPAPGVLPPPSAQPRPVPGVMPLPRILPTPAPGAMPLPRAQPVSYAQAIAQCRDENTKLHAENIQLLQRARVSKRISGQESRQLHAMEQRLHQMRLSLLRVGLNMPSCRAIGEQIARDHEALARIATR